MQAFEFMFHYTFGCGWIQATISIVVISPGEVLIVIRVLCESSTAENFQELHLVYEPTVMSEGEVRKYVENLELVTQLYMMNSGVACRVIRTTNY